MATVGKDALTTSTTFAPPTCIAKCKEVARPGYSDGIDASEFQDSKEVMREKVAVLVSLIRSSKNVCVYTGAGISTSAGIGDYASKAPSSKAPHKRSVARTNRLSCEPTYSHHALAALSRKNLVHHWLQQNHDRLAQKAGYPQSKLNEIHGAWGDNKNRVKMMDDSLRPDLCTWMEQWQDRTDLCIAAGTSLCGMYSDCVAESATERGPKGMAQSGQNGLVIINLQATPYDDKATLRIWGLLDDVFRELMRQLKIKTPSRRCTTEGKKWTESHPGLKYNTPKRSYKDKM